MTKFRYFTNPIPPDAIAPMMWVLTRMALRARKGYDAYSVIEEALHECWALADDTNQDTTTHERTTNE